MPEWLTTHYPHRAGDPERYDIYLQANHKNAARDVAVGERVWFYELAAARAVRGERGPRPRGRLGVVHFARVTGPIHERDRTIEYADGTAADWRWGVPMDAGESGGFVSRARLCEILGYRPGYTFRGFAGGTGLRCLDEAQATQLLRAFRGGTPPWRVPPTGR